MEKQIRNYLKILETAPDNRPAFEALASIYEENERWGDMAALYEKKAQATSRKEDIPDLLFSAAELYADRLARQDKVEECYLGVLNIAPDNSKALTYLKDAYKRDHNWEKLIKLLEHEADVKTDASARADIYTDIARISAEDMGVESRREIYLRKALTIAPDHLPSLKELKLHYLKNSRINEAITLVEKEEQLLKDEAEKAELYHEVGMLLAEDPFMREKAIEFLTRGQSLDKRKKSKKKLDELVGMEKNWQKVARAYEEEAVSISDKIAASSVYLKAAAIYYIYAHGDSEQIMSTVEKAIILDSANRRAFLLGERFMNEQQDWPRLADFYKSFYERTRNESLIVEAMDRHSVLLAEKISDDKESRRLDRVIIEKDPDHVGAVERMAARLKTAADWGTLEDMLKDCLGRAKSDIARVRILKELVELFLGAMDDRREAMKHLEQLWTLAPADPEVAGLLLPVYESEGNWEKLLGVYGILQQNADTDAAKAEWGFKSGELLRTKLEKPEDAFNAYAGAFISDPSNTALVSAMEELAIELECWEKYVELLKTVLAKDTKPANWRDLKFRLGQAYDKELSLYKEAAAIYNDILADGPDILVLDALGRLYRKEMEWEKFVEVMGWKVEILDDIDARRGAAIEQADVVERELGDPMRAAKIFEDILAVSPGELEILKRLEEIYTLNGQWKLMVDTLKRELGVTTSIPEKMKISFKLGSIYQDNLDDLDSAARAYIEVVKLDPTHQPAVEALEQLLDLGILPADIFRGLEPHYVEKKNFEKLLHGYEVLLEGEKESFSRGELYRKLADISLHRNEDPEKAFEYIAASLDTDYLEDGLMDLGFEAARYLDSEKKLFDMLEKRVKRESDAARKSEIHLCVANAYWKHAQNIDGAEEHILEAVELSPESATVLGKACAFYEGVEKWAEYAETALKLAEVIGEESERKQVLYKVAGVFENKLSQLAQAVAVYEKIVVVDAADEKALVEACRIYEALEEWTRACDTILFLLNLVKNSQDRLALKLRLAGIENNRLGQHEVSAKLYKEILADDPHNEEAVFALEGLMEDGRALDVVAATLLPVYEQKHDSSRLTQVLIIQYTKAKPEDSYALAVRIANIFEEELNDAASALDWYGKAYLNEQGASLLDHLVELAERTGAYDKLVEIGQARLEHGCADDEEKKTLLFIMAEKQLNKLEDLEGAKSNFKAILEQWPEEERVLDALIQIARAEQNYADLVELLDRKRVVAAEKNLRRAASIEMAEICHERFEDNVRAITLLKEILDERENDAEISDKLAFIYELEGRYEELYGLLNVRLKYLREEDEFLPVRIQMGDLLENRLGRVPEAIALYRELAINYGVHPAVSALVERLMEQEDTQLEIANEMEEKYIKASDWQHLIRVYEIQLKHAGDKKKKNKLLHKVGDVYREKLKDTEKAFEGFARIFIDEPTNNAALEELEKMAGELGYWKELAEVYERAGAASEDPVMSSELFVKAARLYEDILALQEEAIKAYRSVLQYDRDNMIAIQALENLCRKTERWLELRDIYLQRVGLAEDVTERKRLFFEVCKLYENQLKQPLEAVRYYEEILNLTPEDVDVINKLLDLYTQREDWNPKAELLNHIISLTDSIEKKNDIKLEIADIYEEKTGNLDAAKSLFMEVLESDDQNVMALGKLEEYVEKSEFQLEVAQFLSPYFELWENWHRYVDMLEHAISKTEEKSERVKLLKKVAETYNDKIAQENLAYSAYSRALREDPTDVQSQQELERLAGTLGLYQQLIALYNDLLGRVEMESEPHVAVNILVNLAYLNEEYLQEIEQAADNYRMILEIQPDHTEALKQLERIYQHQKKWDELIDILQRKLDLCEAVEDKKSILFQICNIYEEELGRNIEAIAQYRRILELDSSDGDVLHALVRLTTAESQWDDLIEVHTRQIDLASGDEEKWQLRHRIGVILLDNLERAEAAADVFEGILSENHAHVETRADMQRVLLMPALELRASLILEPYYLEESKWEQLIQALAIQVRHAEEAEKKHSLLWRMADLSEGKLGDYGRAFGFVLDVFEISPFDGSVRQRLETLADVTDGFLTLSEAYRNQAAEASDVASQVDLYLLAGKYSLEKLNNLELAENYYSAVRVRQNDNLAALNALDDIFDRTGQWEKLVELLYRKVELSSETQEKIELYSRAAQIQEGNLENRKAAVAGYVLAQGVNPDYKPVLFELDRLYSALGMWVELRDIVAHRIELEEEARARHDLILRLSELYERRLGERETAFGLYCKVLSEDDERDEALGAVEAMVLDSGLQTRALEFLAPLYQGKGWWQRLANLYERELSTKHVPTERIAVLTRIKEIYEQRLSDAQAAFETACRIYSEDFYNTEVRQEMERLAVVTGGFERLVETYESFFDGASEDVELRIDLLLKIARIQEEQLQNDRNAVNAYRRILEIDTKHMTAIVALDRLYEKLEMWVDLIELIPQEFELFDDAKEIVEQKLRLGRLWEEKLNDLDTAIEVYRQVTDQYPDNITALTALERIYEAKENWEALIEIYRAMVRIARGDTKKARLYGKMGYLITFKLERAEEAIPMWERVLQFDETNEEALTSLEKIYLKLEMWPKLIGHYKQGLQMARTTAERADLTRRMAELYHNRLGMVDQATQLYLKVLDLTPENIAVVDTLQEIYIANKAWRDLVSLLDRLKAQLAGAELRAVNLRLASIYIERLNEPEKGEQYAWEVLNSSALPDELSRLEALFRNSSSYKLYLAVLENQAAVSDDSNTLIAINFRMADIWAAKLNDIAKARECYEKILAVDPVNLQAAELIEPIYAEMGEWNRLVDIYDIRLKEAAKSAEKIDIYNRKMLVYRDRLGDFAQAFDTCGMIFIEDPTDESVIDSMTDLAGKAGRYEDLVEMLSAALDSISSDPTLFRRIVRDCALLFEQKLGNQARAVEFFKKLVDSGEHDLHAIDYLIAYYENNADWENLVDAYRLKLPHMTQEEKVVVGCRVADIYDRHLNQTDRSVKTYQQILKMDDSCREAVNRLAEIFQRQSDWQRLTDILRHKLHQVAEPGEIEEIRLSLAALYLDKIQDLRQAKTYYRAIIADNPAHLGALDSLELIYLAEENYDELLEVLGRRVNIASDNKEKIAIYRKISDIWQEKFGQRDMAVSYLEKVLEIDSGDIQAIEALERVYRESGDWQALVGAYQRHIDQTADADEVVRICIECGRIYGEKLGDSTAAISFFQKALQIDEENLAVMQALVDLECVNGRWEEAVATLEKMSDLAPDKKHKVSALSQIGRILLDHLGQREKARIVFEQMYKEDPTFLPAIRALREYHAAVKDWKAFSKMVEEEKRHVTDPIEKADLLYEEGRYLHEIVGDMDAAIRNYRQALEAHPDHAGALKITGGIFFERHEWDASRRSLERYLELFESEMEEAEIGQMHYMLAFGYEQTNDDSEALKHYTASYKIDANLLPTLEGLARTLFKRGDWERSFRVYQTILVRYRDKKSVPELVELFCRLGEVNGKLGKDEMAARMYEKALELAPDSVVAIKAIVKFYERLESWKKVLQYRGRLIKKLEGKDLAEQWRAVGDIYIDRLGDVDKGLEAYRYAIELDATDVDLLTRVADILFEKGELGDAIGVYRSAVEMEKDPAKLLDLHFRLGNLLREHAPDKDKKDCIEHYNAALDIDYKAPGIFEIIENFLIPRKDWEELDNCYRLHLSRIPLEDKSRLVIMWKKLGDLLADKLGDLAQAIAAWEAVANLLPDDIAVQEKVADLYSRDPVYREKAITMHKALLAENPNRISSYRAMWKICFESEEFDQAWCFAGVVKYLGDNDSPASKFYSDNLHNVKVDSINSIDPNAWGTLLLHPDARNNIGQIFNMLYYNYQGIMNSDIKSENLSRKEHIDLDEQVSVSTLVNYVTKVLSGQRPEAYFRPDSVGVDVVPLQPPTIVIGSNSMEKLPTRQMTFLLAVNTVLSRPSFLGPMLLSDDHVWEYLDASAQIFDPKFASRCNPEELKKLRKAIDKAIPRKQRDMFQGFAEEYMVLAKDLNLERWRHGLRLSAYRAGMLLANDFNSSVDTLKSFPGRLNPKQLNEVIEDLKNYSISKEYFHLRNFLGFSIV